MSELKPMVDDIIFYKENQRFYRITSYCDKTGQMIASAVRDSDGVSLDKRRSGLVGVFSFKEYEITARPSEQYLAYHRGFVDGVKSVTRREEMYTLRARHWITKSYEYGYEDGMRHKGKALDKWCREIGYKPRILREGSSDDKK